MKSIAIRNRSFTAPLLVPSLSSFETQLNPLAGIRLHLVLQEPISLVSAYDMHTYGDVLIDACTEYQKHGILLVDSGGYETSRISRYGTPNDAWSFDDYARISSNDFHMTFSPNPMKPPTSIRDVYGTILICIMNT